MHTPIYRPKAPLSEKYKQYRLSTTYRGIRIEVLTVAPSRTKAAEVLGVSTHYLKEYCSGNKPTIKECIENPCVKFVLFDRAGEGMLFLDKEIFTTVLTVAKANAIIDNHRKRFPNYDATLKMYNKPIKTKKSNPEKVTKIHENKLIQSDKRVLKESETELSLMQQNEKLMRLLESLTPGGSEFVGDPERCADFIKKQVASFPKTIVEFRKKIKLLTDTLKSLHLEVVDLLSRGKNHTPSWDKFDRMRKAEKDADQVLKEIEKDKIQEVPFMG